ncbi:MAG: hypothetical protein IAI49_01010 [Candidatus Eremiobacteraeota bacterium]|nr:hypothetical protein [Candidatus Eremiobacteraeota bacterium]
MLALVIGGGLLALPLAASAQTQGPPSDDETIRGTVDSLPSHYALKLRDARGFIDSVTLRDDTVINPSSLQLTSGLSVTIIGHPDGETFDADEIDAESGTSAQPNAPADRQPAARGDEQAPDGQPTMPAPDGPANGPAYDTQGQDPGDDSAYAPAPTYGVPYLAPAVGIGIGAFGYYGGAYYGGPYYYGGAYYGGPYYYGGGYYYHGGRYVPYPRAPGSHPLPVRRAPGYGYPNGSVRPISRPDYRAPVSHSSSSSADYRSSGGGYRQ